MIIFIAIISGLISKGAFNEQGGLQHASIIDRSLIDIYVPFLPLERSHVRQCIDKELHDLGIESTRLPAKFGEHVVAELSFSPPDTKVFAIAGCKAINNNKCFIVTFKCITINFLT